MTYRFSVRAEEVKAQDGTKMRIDMRRNFIVAVLLLSMMSCEKRQDVSVKHFNKVSFEVCRYDIEEDCATKTSISGGTNFVWSAGDTVGIYPDSGGQVYFSMKDGAGAQYASFDGGGWEFKTGALYYGYYPFNADMYLDKTHIPVSYRYQRQEGINSTEHIGEKDFMYTAPTSSTNGSLDFSFNHLSCIIRPRLTLPAGIYTKLSIVIEEKLFAIEGYYSLESTSPAIVGTSFSNTIDLMLDNVTLTEQTQFLTYLMAAPVELTGEKVRIIVYNDAGKQYVYEKTPSFTYTAGKICGLTCTEYSSSDVGGITIGGDDEAQMDNDIENVQF